MVVGTVLRSHAGGHLVHSDELDTTLQCAARGRLKKERITIVTGDKVEVDEIESENLTAVITARLERQNLLSRPTLANVDQVVIVQAVHQPEWNALLCDRYLVHYQLELPGSRPLICLNKCDLSDKKEISALQKIYEPLGYIVTIVSAKTGEGMSELSRHLKGKISVLAGPSGVGKSSIINYMVPNLNLKVGVMENDFGVGRHTTTYNALYRIQPLKEKKESSWVADTPGFSLTELKHPDPRDLPWQFPELARLGQECRYGDCLHLVENDCSVLNNMEEIAGSRYESYTTMVAESKSEREIHKQTSRKVEASVKSVGGKKGEETTIPKLKGSYRAQSRRTEKQQLKNLTIETEDEYEDSQKS